MNLMKPLLDSFCDPDNETTQRDLDIFIYGLVTGLFISGAIGSVFISYFLF